MTGTDDGGPVPHSQTLDRGIRVLETLAGSGRAMTIVDLAAAHGVHRSIVYRILRTLEDHRLVSRLPDGRCELGPGLSVLARGVSRSLQVAATPELVDLANDAGMTAFLAVADQADCVTLLSVEPRHSQVHVAYRPGVRHPLDRGAPGLALLAGARAVAGERPEVTEARRRGFARTRGEVLPGMTSIAVPVTPVGLDVVASVAVVYVDQNVDEHQLGRRVRQAAERVAVELS